jgi:hypothetical protein
MKIHRLWLALPLATTPFLLQEAPAPSIRDELTAVYDRWEQARTSFDESKMEELLAPDFFVQIGPERLTRTQFIDEVSVKRPDALLTRFDADILTLTREKDVWVAVITEKLEFDVKGPDGKRELVCSLWVTRDAFRKDDAGWRIVSSEALGWESWGGGRAPPFADWKS